MQATINSAKNTERFTIEKMSQVSLTKGYWFYFDHEGNDISMFGSTWNGKEIVYFNNKPVSSFRNLNKLKSEHTFSANGHEYSVTTEMKSILRGTIEVQVFCDGELIQTESVSQIEKGTFFKSLFSTKNLIFLVVCFCAGFAITYFELFDLVFS